MTTLWRDHVPILRPPAPLASTGAARQALHRGLRGWWMALGPRLTWVLWIENISVISTHQPAARTHTPSISSHQPIEIDITECKTLHDPIRSNPKVSFDNCHSVFEAVKMMRRTNKRSLSQFSRCNTGGGFILMRPRSECQNYANHSRKCGHDTSPRVSRAAARECSLAAEDCAGHRGSIIQIISSQDGFWWNMKGSWGAQKLFSVFQTCEVANLLDLSGADFDKLSHFPL